MEAWATQFQLSMVVPHAVICDDNLNTCVASHSSSIIEQPCKHLYIAASCTASQHKRGMHLPHPSHALRARAGDSTPLAVLTV